MVNFNLSALHNAEERACSASISLFLSFVVHDFALHARRLRPERCRYLIRCGCCGLSQIRQNRRGGFLAAAELASVLLKIRRTAPARTRKTSPDTTASSSSGSIPNQRHVGHARIRYFIIPPLKSALLIFIVIASIIVEAGTFFSSEPGRL